MKQWWKERVVYQIYPRSFYDSNGDGIGDIPGIILQLNTLKELGVGTLWLSPVYDSPNEDNGYDISDYKAIHPEYGTMEDMDRLIAEANKRDIKIIMDLVINHTSNQHEWFKKSRERIEPYTDYYIWRDGKNGGLPNNWTSFFAEDCWVYDDIREQYYLHLFAKGQPDLNYYNPDVLAEVKSIMKFWLDKGIAGFRCDVINVIYKSSFEDGRNNLVLVGNEYYISQEGTHEILRELRRDVLDNYDCFTVGETVFVTPHMARNLCHEDRKELDMIFSFEHTDADQYFIKWFRKKFNSKQFSKTLSKWQYELDWNALYFENHDQMRSVSRYGDESKFWMESAKMLATLLLSLRGTPFIFQGQEIGMTNFDYKSFDEINDVESHNVNEFLKKFKVPSAIRWQMIKSASRDNSRTPVQWNKSKHGGFTSGMPWLRVNKNYKKINVDSQVNDALSIWHYYKRMIAFRQASEAMVYGDFKELEITGKFFAFERSTENERKIVLVNFTKSKVHADYQGKVVMSNLDKVAYNGVLEPFEAIILEV